MYTINVHKLIKIFGNCIFKRKKSWKFVYIIAIQWWLSYDFSYILKIFLEVFSAKTRRKNSWKFVYLWDIPSIWRIFLDLNSFLVLSTGKNGEKSCKFVYISDLIDFLDYKIFFWNFRLKKWRKIVKNSWKFVYIFVKHWRSPFNLTNFSTKIFQNSWLFQRSFKTPKIRLLNENRKKFRN